MKSSARGDNIASTGWDEAAAAQWIARDDLQETLKTPWTFAAALAGVQGRPVERVLDVASGPGGFLRTVLDYFPGATGRWFDFSETMRDEAERTFEDQLERVVFQLGDINELEAAGDPESFDLVTSSRASHHLSTGQLGHFYANVATLLRPGGWFANLDILHPGERWWERMRATDTTLRGGVERRSNHPHLVPMPPTEDHLACARAAGLEEGMVVWRSLISGLVMARKPDAH